MLKLFRFKDFLNKNFDLPEIQIPQEPRSVVLTKSRFMLGLKCDSLLWNQYHTATTHHYSPKNESNLHRMNIQNESVLFHARNLYPNGVEIPRQTSMFSAHKLTQKNLEERKVIYNASFLSSEFFSRTDILIPSEEDDSWEIIQIKSSINIKRDNVKDLLFQLHVAKLCGLNIKDCSILNVNPHYVFENELDLKQFFVKISLLEKMKYARDEFSKQLTYFKSLIHKADTPSITQEYSCSSPKNCSLKTCWNELGDGDIFNLREGGDLVLKFYKSGIRYLKDIPDNPDLTFSQKVQIETERTKIPYLQIDKLKDFVNSFQYPLYFLDFETINPALPIYPKTKPYQHIPFLYSLHVQINPDLPLEHYSFIDNGKEDPRLNILSELSKLISSKGTIICYNDTFEKRCLRESVELFPQYADWYSSILENFKDLSDPFKFFYYYHPDQKGSASLKAVLPALTGLDYKELGINDGNMANLEFLRSKIMKLSSEEVNAIYSLLSEYCKMDTYAMVKVVEALRRLV
ncbi:MAG TPA: DUF2779 domain-containing protein [Leptospiraceae bacterium]|nr:DUF2779 domain-containing protein [Leptospiraceae bacterium]